MSVYIMLILSVLCFLCINKKGIVLLCALITLTLMTARAVDRRKSKILMSLYVFLVVILLVAVRNTKFGNVYMPIGISFAVLKCISYTVDVYRSKYSFDRNISYFLLYILFFPTIYMGPITRYDDMKKEFLKKHKYSFDNTCDGIFRIVLGLFKKLVIADRLMEYVTFVVEGDISGLSILIMLLVYSVVLYCDFAGGIDIALGICTIIDVKVCENFKMPYLSTNLAQFWQTWHISLGQWFKEYVFYPISVNTGLRRLLKKRMNGVNASNFCAYIGILFTWILTGLWHGTELRYALWGLLNAVIIIIIRFMEVKKIKPVNKIFGIAGTYLIVSMLRVFDLYTNVSVCFEKLFTMFTDMNCIAGFSAFSLIEIIISAVALVYMFVLGRLKKKTFYTKAIFAAVTLVLIVVFGKYGFAYNSNGFIYGNY